MIIVASFLLSVYGFLHFLMSVKKHHMDVYKGWHQAKPLSQREYRVMQTVAWLSMLLSYVCAIQHWGLGVGSMAWCLLISVAALLMAALLSYRLSWLQKLWRWTSVAYRLAPPAGR